MVVEPSEAVFNDMMSKVNTLPSYTGGDQGFLNSYYSDFPNAHVFDPNIPQEVLKVRPVPEMERLSTLYNADVGLYMLANKWMVDESELRVIHYKLGPLKPWDWWTFWLLKPVDVWQNVGERLEETLPGTGGGKNPNDELLTGGFLFRTSLCNHIRHLYFIIRSSGTVAYSGVSSSSNINVNNPTKVPVYLGGISVFVCFMAAVVSLGISITIVPQQVMPWTDHRQASSCDIVSWYYGLGMAFLAIVAPSLPCIFGITTLFLRLGLMVVGGIILASFMTYASEHLASRSFLKGCEDRDTTQSRECFLC
ncbi:hypothetical protein ES319_A11G262000v1 [Gossypium barbadense]|nr:hypothetical protein ES319_A11G262000v1 [Gossypium barbadense]